MGWRRLLDPRLVCADCRMLWSDTEALTGSWVRQDGQRESLLIRQHYVLFTALVCGGLILMLWLVLRWWDLESNSSWQREAGFDWLVDEPSAERVWGARFVVPALIVGWFGLLLWMGRTRVNTNPTAVGVVMWFAIALLASLVI
jgi:hypothetical protein